MRLWSLHPKYLDSKGLVALWREGLLALNVLQDTTKGYKNHPQLIRFKSSKNPVQTISSYLRAVVDEADMRGYNFKREKLPAKEPCISLTVTTGQIDYEYQHLLNKLKIRDESRYEQLMVEKKIKPHPLFNIKAGAVESWEIV